jgi:hypothetical protein
VSELSEIDFWGETLVRWSVDVVAKMGIAAEDSTYLTAVGLPVGIDWSLRITSPASGTEPGRIDGMPIVAFDGPVPLCVDWRAGGRVVAVEDDRRRTANSSVRQFGAFLMLFQDYRRRVRGLDDEKAEVLIDDVERRMREREPEIMRGDENYWPVIVEQMRHRLL